MRQIIEVARSCRAHQRVHDRCDIIARSGDVEWFAVFAEGHGSGGRIGLGWIEHHLREGEIGVGAETVARRVFEAAIDQLVGEGRRNRGGCFPRKEFGQPLVEYRRRDVRTGEGALHPEAIIVHQVIAEDHQPIRLPSRDHHNGQSCLLPSALHPTAFQRVLARLADGAYSSLCRCCPRRLLSSFAFGAFGQGFGLLLLVTFFHGSPHCMLAV